MKEVNLLLNGIYLNKGDYSTSIFLHNITELTIIDLVEYQQKKFKQRIEFKKYPNNYQCLFFSNFITPNFVFSANITLSENNEIVESFIEFQTLKPNSTNIIEAYYLDIASNKYSLKHIITHSIETNIILNGNIENLSLANIDTFLFGIINTINNLRTIQNKKALPINLNINHFLRKEQEILNLVQDFTTNNPDLEKFIHNYNPISRKRIK